MAERAMLSITCKRLNEIVSGLAALKERKNPSIQIDLRIAAQFKRLAPIQETIQKRRKQIIAEHEMAGDDASDTVKLRDKIELRKKLDALDEEVIQISAPLKKLTKEDLPQPIKGEHGDNNTMGLAAIMIALAPEFFDLPEETE